ncbi:DNA polymerase III subunit alpha [Maribellus sp. CM-23]|uniref:DNA polymerase III subunit alpha n=1 Tax=Maribellus sp. CM-23 TaxID=2781026 RepID=UPI001F238209|nr:DNA polymerase III subunit alpha [Maribellus sp. CM-23]MCE4566886.1 DNA polymerase III subunit alpha [Maribellus sp. CM-23]
MLLNCHTYFSYKYGTISIDALIQEAIEKGYRSLVLTDINNTSAAIDFIRLCTAKDIKPVVGIDFRNGAQQKYVGIARNNDGFRAMNEHLICHLHSGKKIPDRAPEIGNAYFIYPIGAVHPTDLKENEFIGVRPSQVNRVFGDLRKYPEKLVVLQSVTFRNKRDFNVHRLLRAIDNNTLLSLLSKSEEASPDEIMWPRQDIYEQFRDFPQLIQNTLRLIDSCCIEFTFKKSKNKKCFMSSPAEDFILLRKMAWEGIGYRFGEPSPKVVERMEKELSIIKQMDFAAYFLINWDLVQCARSQGCYYVGRGSGANSMIAYLLRITDVDPVELDLYFERFINPSRKSPPDFDIDFASRDRDHITRYIFDRYGWDRVALVGTYITFQYKSMVRELGKVFGLPALEIEKLQAVKDFQELDDIGRLVLKYSKLIHGFPSHLSVHSSGILISEEPISAYTATIMPPKGFPTVHFSMIEAEDLGFAKFDILGQRGLSKIEDAISIIRENKGDEIDIHDLPAFKKDEQVKELLKHGNTIGCFYVESPAMRMLLTKLEADDYLRLVAASSIIRPGVAQSGMMREYILRYRDRSRCVAARNEAPELYHLLEETYGVMVYQEDVIKVAHLFAGLTLAESDILRRGMSWKFKQRNEFGKVHDKFFSNCAEKGYDRGLVQRVWTQIESFANYAFSKGHSASYAVESYQALFLKAYYPLEYLVATINNGGGFYRTELYVHEARMNGGKIFPPCVNRSNEETVIGGKVIFLGLGFLKSLEATTIDAVLTERRRSGYFRSLQDFLLRVPVSLEQVSILIRVGAFNFTGKSKKELLWNAHFILSKSKKTAPERTLFQQEVKEFTIPDLYYHPLEDAYDEIELLGFPVTRSPFGLLEELKLPQTVAADLTGLIGQHVSIVGSLVNVKYTRSGNGKSMTFGVFIDFEGHWIDTVQFPTVAEKYPFRGGGCYFIKGKVMEEFGFISIETTELYRLPNENMEEPSTRLKVPKTMALRGKTEEILNGWILRH